MVRWAPVVVALAVFGGAVAPRGAPATAKSAACLATPVHYQPAKQPGYSDVPWLLTTPSAQGVLVSLVSPSSA